jgi:hypothetical protein
MCHVSIEEPQKNTRKNYSISHDKMPNCMSCKQELHEYLSCSGIVWAESIDYFYPSLKSHYENEEFTHIILASENLQHNLLKNKVHKRVGLNFFPLAIMF